MTTTEPAVAPSRWVRRLEIVEAVALALVAIATAFRGYQGAQWGGEQARLYGLASTTRFQADAASTLGGQQLAADASFFTAWLQARGAGNNELASMMEARFSPAYASAFRDWLATDPFTNPDAPAGPGAMPGFASPEMVEAGELNDRAAAYFASGTEARENANRYVRQTVLFASVLFLIAIAQRFRTRGVRIAVSALALGMLVFTLYGVVVLPRI